MKIYHTSDRVIATPDISFSRKYLDFGKGFYTTPNEIQARKYAKRFFKEDRKAFLNIYEWDEDSANLFTKKVFEAYDGDWLDYVVACRHDDYRETFDIIEGGIADDDVFNTLDLYMDELIDKDEAIKRLKKKKPNWQICFSNQEAIEKTIRFVESIELKGEEI